MKLSWHVQKLCNRGFHRSPVAVLTVSVSNGPAFIWNQLFTWRSVWKLIIPYLIKYMWYNKFWPRLLRCSLLWFTHRYGRPIWYGQHFCAVVILDIISDVLSLGRCHLSQETQNTWYSQTHHQLRRDNNINDKNWWLHLIELCVKGDMFTWI